jgi:hypothetical protein
MAPLTRKDVIETIGDVDNVTVADSSDIAAPIMGRKWNRPRPSTIC